MRINVYIDESGDQGWILNKPLRKGGSSRFYCCAFLIVPTHLGNKTKQIVQSLYLKWNIPASKELKGSEMTNKMRYFLGQKVTELLEVDRKIRVRVVVLKKSRVPELAKNGPFDLLRNHMLYLGTKNAIGQANEVLFFPDRKPVQKARLHAAKDYLTARTWFDHNQMVNISYEPKESNGNWNLIFIDWISNTFWRYFENDIVPGFDKLKEHVEIVHFNF